MTISELEYQLADMGFKVRGGEDNQYYYIDDIDNNGYAYIDKNNRFLIDTDTNWFKDLQTKKRKRLFNALMEVADKIIGMLPPIAAIKKTKVAVE
jgi:hypothetical protein|nr:MAG TPA: hypothetical protein [Caudoviricetes sp.]